MAKQPSTHPIQVMEEEAQHAFLEWPVWLVLREKELASHLATYQTSDRPQADPRAASVIGTDRQSDKER